MKQFSWVICLLLLSCKTVIPPTEKAINKYATDKSKYDFTLAFGSCNKSSLPNILWDDIQKDEPDVWIWGGDIVYADTDNTQLLKGLYNRQLGVKGYQKLLKTTEIIGTWDDHDYGLNDGGAFLNSKMKVSSCFLTFYKFHKMIPAGSAKEYIIP